MPRASAISQAYPAPPGKRLRPPDDFPPGSPERAFFLETVNGLPSDHFAACDSASLAVYVAAYIDLLVARGELKASGNVMPDGKANPLIAVVRDLGRTVNVMARSLRLNPVSRAPQQPGKIEPQNLSYYDLMEQREAKRDGAN